MFQVGYTSEVWSILLYRREDNCGLLSFSDARTLPLYGILLLHYLAIPLLELLNQQIHLLILALDNRRHSFLPHFFVGELPQLELHQLVLDCSEYLLVLFLELSHQL